MKLSVRSLVFASLFSLAPAHAAPVKPPAKLQKALAERGCAVVDWSALPGGNFGADCASAKSGEEIGHRYFLLLKKPDGSFALQRIYDWVDTDSIRAKAPASTRVVVKGGRITIERTDEFGWVQAKSWDGASGALVEEREGGRKICQEGISDYNSKIAEPLCTRDDVHRREVCGWDHPDCRGEASAVKRENYLAIPVHNEGATLRGADVWACATKVGADKADISYARTKGGKWATFLVVAIDDDKQKKLKLVARVEDKTPQPVSAPDGDWQPRDHLELWIASGRLQAACPDVADLDKFCKAKLEEIKAVQFIVVPSAQGARVIQATRDAGIDGKQVSATGTGNEVTIELTGSLYQWAHEGSLTLAYSDSVDGKKQDALIATSALKWNKPETFGRLGDSSLCDQAKVPEPPTIIP